MFGYLLLGDLIIKFTIAYFLTMSVWNMQEFLVQIEAI
jgi:hypothetical protein